MVIPTGLVPAPWHDAAVAPKLRRLMLCWLLPSPASIRTAFRLLSTLSSASANAVLLASSLDTLLITLLVQSGELQWWERITHGVLFCQVIRNDL